MSETAPKWGEWYDTEEGPKRELSSYDGLILDREYAYADYLNALEAQVTAAGALVAAVEFYGVRERYLHDDSECPPICADEGEAARAALAQARAAGLAPPVQPG